MFASAKGTHQKKVRQLQYHEQCIYHILYYILPFGIVTCTFFPTTFLEIAGCDDFGIDVALYEMTGPICLPNLEEIYLVNKFGIDLSTVFSTFD